MTNEEIRRMTDDDLDSLIAQKKNYLPEPIIPPIRPTKDIHQAACLLGQLERDGWERADSTLIRTDDFPHALVIQKAGFGIGFGCAKTLERAISEAVAMALCKIEEVTTTSQE